MNTLIIGVVCFVVGVLAYEAQSWSGLKRREREQDLTARAWRLHNAERHASKSSAHQ